MSVARSELRGIVARNLKRRREALGISQPELEAKCGKRVGMIESGDRMPRAETMDAIASALGVTSQWLMQPEMDNGRPHEALEELLASPVGKTVTSDEKKQLRAWNPPGEPTFDTYYMYLQTLRTMKPPPPDTEN